MSSNGAPPSGSATFPNDESGGMHTVPSDEGTRATEEFPADGDASATEEFPSDEGRDAARVLAGAARDDVMRIFTGGGEMGALMRALDWAATPLGPVDTWSQSLRTAVSICLASRFPMLLWWGPELVMLYNDAYRPILGRTKHPAAMGQRGRACWPEIWDVIGPMLKGVLERGEATWSDDQLLLLDRNGYVEECYFTFSYSPIRDESGGVGGIFTAVTETTARVLGERRLRTLRDLAARTGEVRSVAEVCRGALEALEANPLDLPFTLLYLVDADGTYARLAGTTGALPTALDVEPIALDAESGDRAAWPLDAAARSGEAVLVSDIGARSGENTEPGAALPRQALVLPIAQSGQARPAGFLVAGLNPRRALDDDYRGFLILAAGQIATALANVRAYEEERKRAEALAELDRAKTAFFSNVSHEFRTPLTLMLGPLEQALAAPPQTPLEQERAQLESAHRNSLRLLRLVNTLLDFARIEAGRAEAVYEPTDLSTLTAELAGVFRAAIERAGLRLLVDCPPLAEPVYVDREMWEKIVLNLLSNAFKHTFAGEIAVRLHAVGAGCAELEVRDSGVGIAEEELPRLFERFHRVRGAQARTTEGTGIGLALVRELVTLHGGSIDVESRTGSGTTVESSAGSGTTVRVRLPLGTAHLPSARIGAGRTLASTATGAAPFVEEALRWLPDGPHLDPGGAEAPVDAGHAVALAETLAGAAPGNGAAAVPTARVLLADDNADMRAYLRRLLSGRYAVEAVADGAAALAAARAQPPDLILSDVMMPGLDGFALVGALRAEARTREVPVILLSARAGQEAVAAGLAAGADDYLVKPFAAGELLARVQAHLALARLRRQALAVERTALGRLQTLQSVSDAALSHLALPELLRRVLAQITAALGADNTAVLLLDDAEDMLTVFAAQGPEEAQTGQMRVPVGQGVAGHIAATRQPLIVDDLRTVEPVNPLLREQMVSLMGVPLLVEGRLIGVLHVDSATPRAFTQDELGLLQLVADRVALALENAGLYGEALQARDQVTRLQRVTAALSAAVTADEVADVVITQGLEALGASVGVVALLAEDGASFTTLRVSGYSPEVVASWPVFSADAAVPIADAVRARAPVVLESRAEHDARYPHVADVHSLAGDGALAAIPLLLGERAVGGLGLSFAHDRRFSAEERAMMGALGELCAQALERARLYEAERRSAARAQARSAELETLLAVLPIGIGIARDPAGTDIRINPAFARMLGITPEANASLSAPPEERPTTFRAYQAGRELAAEELPLQVAAARDVEVRDMEVELVRDDGARLTLLEYAAPLHDAEGRVRGSVGAFLDITALRALERAREEFLASAAHDLKTPLTGIRGHAQLARRRLARLALPELARIAEHLAQIDLGTVRMVDLIDDLLDVTQAQAGQTVTPVRQQVDLVALLRGVVAQHAGLSEHRIHVETALSPFQVPIDAARIERVVGNLLSNAIKYSPEGGEIMLRLTREDSPDGPAAVIAVEDHGLGIPPADLPHIFEPFRRASNVVGQIAGTGIGLASVRQIVAAHGGTIEAASREGQGSTFTVRLPLNAPPADHGVTEEGDSEA